ncbi:MBG domain-containing protein, partial [Roseivirga echinicomitans]
MITRNICAQEYQPIVNDFNYKENTPTKEEGFEDVEYVMSLNYSRNDDNTKLISDIEYDSYPNKLVVSGAGTQSVNGDYYYAGTFSYGSRDLPYYQKGSWYLYLLVIQDFPWEPEIYWWRLGNTLGGNGSSQIAYSFNVNNESEVPTNPVRVGRSSLGTDPVPTITSFISPTATNVAVSGTMSTGEELTGTYTYSYPDGDEESGSTFKWYRSDNASGANKTAIAGATLKTYTLTNDDINKYISFEVTPSDGTIIGGASESILTGPVLGPLLIQAIARQNPTDQTVSASEVTFRVTFNGSVINVTTDDFSLNSTVGGTISSVSEVTTGVYDVTVINIKNVDGTLALQIKGVDGASGSNDIKKAIFSTGTKTISQTDVNDYLNQAKLGQTFTATTDNYLTAYTIYPKSGNHSFSGTADLKIYSGNELAGDATLIGSQTINISNSTDAAGQTITIENPISLTQGEVYSIIMENFSGSGSHALESSTSGNYDDGRVIFTGTDPTSHETFDLKIDIYEGTATAGNALSVDAPQTNESYTLEAINAAPTVTNVTFTGTPELDEVLTGSYTYADSEDDVESGTSFKWYRSDDDQGTNKTAISGATNKTYTLTEDDEGKYISFEVTPNDGVSAGTAVESVLLKIPEPVLDFTFEESDGTEHYFPQATGKYSIARVKQPIDFDNPGIYEIDYEIKATGHWPGQGGFVYGMAGFPLVHATFHELGAEENEWGYRSRSGQSYINNIASNIGTVVNQIGDRIRLQYDTRNTSLYVYTKKVDTTEYTLQGAGPISNAVKPDEGQQLFFATGGICYQPCGVEIVGSRIPENAPIASNVSYSGSLVVGEPLTGSYTYTDKQDDPESGSTFKWYRSDDDQGTNKAAIDGATSQTYTLVEADVDKYISFEVTPNDGNHIGATVESSLDGPVIVPLVVTSIERQDPSEETITSPSATFRVTFSSSAGNVTTDDFSINSTVGGTIASVEKISASVYDVTVNNLSNANGTLSLQVKGVDGTSGSNDIQKAVFDTGTKTISQTDDNDHLGQAKLGQTFTATTNNYLTAFTIYPKAGSHNFSGTTDLKVYSGNEDDGNATLLSSQSISITTSTDAAGQTFIFTSPVQLNQGDLYSIVMTNFSGSGSRAFYSSTSGNYANGQVIFTGNSGSHANFDLKIDIYEGTLTLGQGLDSDAPAVHEGYIQEVGDFPPTATNVSFAGALKVGRELTGTYTYADGENDAEDGTTFQWYRSDNDQGTNKSAIAGATNSTYTLVAEDTDKYISFEVTPNDGTSAGIAIESSLQGAVVNPIVIIESLSINNSMSMTTSGDGQSFTATSDGVLVDVQLVTNDASSATLKIYEGSGTGGGLLYEEAVSYVRSNPEFSVFTLNSSVSVTENSVYTFLLFNDSGCFDCSLGLYSGNAYDGGTAFRNGAVYTSRGNPRDLKFRVTISTNVAPIASNVSFAGALETGEVLTGSYDYSDDDEDEEEGTTFQWYRSDDDQGANKTAISGATSKTYTLTEDDEGKYISFSVVPNNGMGGGNEVGSSLQGAVPIVPPVVSSIVRQNPNTATTSEASVTFRVTFSKDVAYVDATDFVLNSTVNGSISAVQAVSESIYDITVSGLDNAVGTVSLGIKGVDGEGGSNDIQQVDIDESTITYNGSGDYLNQSTLGQTFIAASSKQLREVTIYPKSGNHTFSGTATLEIYNGDQYAGSTDVIATQTVDITSSTGSEGQTFEIESPPQLTQGNTYTFLFSNFSGSGSHALVNSVNAGYADGHVIFTGLNQISHVNNLDLAFKVHGAILDLGASLAEVAPITSESYTKVLANVAPVASNVSITGDVEIGQELTATYDYTDNEDDAEDGTTYQWYRADDANGTNQTPIADASSIDYTLSLADYEKYLGFGVTPSDGEDTGVEVITFGNTTVPGRTRPVEGLTNFNHITEDRILAEGTGAFEHSVENWLGSGWAVTFQKHEPFTYLDASGLFFNANDQSLSGRLINDFDLPSESYFFFRSVDGTPFNLNSIYGGVINGNSPSLFSHIYPNNTIVLEDGYELRDVSALAEFKGIKSFAIKMPSDPYTDIEFLIRSINIEYPPIARDVGFTGNTVVGRVLTGSYTYEEFGGNPESGTTYQWYRSDDLASANKTAIAGATNITYTLTNDDLGKYISFEVTPNDGSSAGNPVESALQGSVLKMPLAVSAIVRDNPTDAVTSEDEVSFLVTFNQKVKGISINDFSISGTTAGLSFLNYDIDALSAPETALDDLISQLAQLNTQLDDALDAQTADREDQLADIESQLSEVEDLLVDAEEMLANEPEKEAEALNMLAILGAQKTNLEGQREALTATETQTVIDLRELIALKEQEIETSRATLNNLYQSAFTVVVSGGDLADLNGDIFLIIKPTHHITDLDGDALSSTTPANTNENTFEILNNRSPSVTNVTFTGILELGETLTGTYDYSDEENDEESGTTFQWYRSDDDQGTNKVVIADATSKTYILAEADNEKYISFVVKPADGSSIGVAVESSLVLVDLTAPMVTITSSINPTSGAFTATFTFSEDVTGFAEADISVSNGAASNFNTTSAKVYTATITPSAEGTVTVDVLANKATDAAGNANTAATQLSVTNDETAPAAPIVASISTDAGTSATDNVTNDQTLEINGTAEANASIEVFIGGASVGNTSADASGDWTFDHTGTTLPEATHSITAKATDAAGNESVESSALSVTIDITAPAAPVVTGISNDTGISDSDGLTNDNELTITGTSEANASVEVFIDNNSIGTTTADENGDWTYDHSETALAENSYSITAKTTDIAGNESSASAGFSLQIDLAGPASAPSVGAVGNDRGLSNSDFITNDQTLIIGGNATANSRVEVFIDGTSIGIATTNNATTWLFNYEGTTLPAGTYSITAKELDDAGNHSPASAAKTLVIDLTQPTVTITSNANDLHSGEFTATFTFNKYMSGFSLDDITVTNGTPSNFDTDDNITYTATITPSADGVVTVGVNANRATDIAGNFNTAATSINVTTDQTEPSLVSIARTSESQITLTFNEPVVPGSSGHHNITVYGGNSRWENAVSVEDGTLGDNKIIANFNTLDEFLGDLEILHSGGSTIADLAGNVYPVDGDGAKIDDTIAPTLVSATKDSDTQITLTFSEEVKVKGTNPTDFTVVDDNNTPFVVQSIADGTAEDKELILTFADLSKAQLSLNITYTDNNGEVSDFGYNDLATDATGVNISLNAIPTATNVDFSGTLTVGERLTGSYTYSDPDNDIENGSTFKWYKSDDANGTNKSAIAGATAQTYDLTSNEVDKYISFEVTPNDGNNAGVAAESSLSGSVNKISQTINFSALTAKTYGDANFSLSATASSNLGVTYTSSNTNVASVNGSTVTVVGAGTAIITASQAGNVSYSAATNITQSLTVNKAVLTGSSDDKNKTYGEANPEFTITYSGFVNGDDKTALTTEPTASTIADASSNVGNYDITISGGSANNYSFVTNKGSLTVSKATLTATADNKGKIYGEANPVFTISYAGFVNGDDKSAITTEPSASTTADASSSVGVYDITLIGGTANNYSFVTNKGSLTVGKATLTATADNKSKVYGEANPALTVSYTGFVNGDDKTAITTEPTAATLADITSGVGAYDITLSGGTANNYSFVTNKGSLTVGKATLTATADNKGKIYGEANPTFTISYTGFVNGDDKTAITTEPSASTTADASSSVGVYDITLIGGTANNYSFVTNKGSLTVGKATLTATADNKSKVYGEANPALTVSYTGFVNGDDKTAITTEPTAATLADITSGVGAYDITLSGGTANNYSFVTNKGSLTVNKAMLTVT